MKAVSTKIKYPCNAKVTYIGGESQNYESGSDYMAEIYKKEGKHGLFICISGHESSERGYVSESLLLKEFTINEVIVEGKTHGFILTISKSGQVSYKHEDGMSTSDIIATLEYVKFQYLLSQVKD